MKALEKFHFAYPSMFGTDARNDLKMLHIVKLYLIILSSM